MKNTTRSPGNRLGTNRTKRGHHLSLNKLRAGYKEQRAWLSVAMETHRVELALEPWVESDHTIVVRYQQIDLNRTVCFEAEERFTEQELVFARALFKTAGQPQQWPTTPTVQSV